MNISDDAEMEAIADVFTGGDSHVLVAETMVGEDAAEFCKSDLGRYLIGRANQEIKIAMGSLKQTFPWRSRRIQQLQNEIRVAEMFKNWLVEAIVSGRTALSELDRRREEIE